MLLAHTITIVGMGLIGGSYGLAIRGRRLADRVIGVSRRETTLRAALELGACGEATEDLTGACADADMILLCTPVSQIPELGRQLAARVKPGAIVTDAGSTKSVIVEQCEAALMGQARFVGGHPMAGSEKTGVRHARADLFEGATYAITRTPRTDENAFNAVQALAQSLGSRPLLIDAQVHDRVVALTSHLPHLAAFALASAVWNGHANKLALASLAATGFRDTTRIAASNPELWRDIFLDNREAILHAVNQYREELDLLREALSHGDGETLTALLHGANDRRAAIVRDEA